MCRWDSGARRRARLMCPICTQCATVTPASERSAWEASAAILVRRPKPLSAHSGSPRRRCGASSGDRRESTRWLTTSAVRTCAIAAGCDAGKAAVRVRSDWLSAADPARSSRGSGTRQHATVDIITRARRRWIWRTVLRTLGPVASTRCAGDLRTPHALIRNTDDPRLREHEAAGGARHPSSRRAP